MNQQREKFFVVTTIPGSLNFFKGQLNFLNRTFEVVAISSNKKTLEAFGEKEGIRTYCIPMERQISLMKDFVSLIRFIILFHNYKPEIVHGNTPKGSFISMIAAKLTCVPIRIYMCHGLRYQGYNGTMKKVLQIMERITCFCATKVICVSYGVKQTLENDTICNGKKLKVVGYGSANGINLNYYNKNQITGSLELLSHLNIHKGAFVYVFVGRIVKDKGVNELVNAFDKLYRQYTNVHLLIVGPEENDINPIDEKSRKIIHENKHIHAVGIQFDVRPYMVASNVFVLPSYREGFGMVLMEAGALEIPCITTNIIGCNEIIQDNINGKIISPHDENILYETMKWFYVHRDKEVKDMSKNARPMIANRYEQRKVWESLLKEYQSLD